MTDPSFFGYGSLVNTRTHTYANPRKARLQGWRRIWRSVEGQDHAVLSVRLDPDSTIAGLIADVPGGDWGALDLREAMYVRQHLQRDLAIYEVKAGVIWPRDPHPILRSYLDVVAAGYHAVFGDQGVQEFFATTDNWRAVLDDRHAPLYPRHHPVDNTVTSLVDRHLAAVVK